MKRGYFMSKIPVIANWDGLSPVDALDIISLVPKTINIEIDSSNPKKMVIEDKNIPLLQEYVSVFGLNIQPLLS